MPASAGLNDRIAEVATTIEARIGAAIAAGAYPARLAAAMRHGTLGPGKRLRPFLVVAVADLFDAGPAVRARALAAGTALECVHCYSLIHDDLPAMDDDAVRRGRPTVHRAFDEATAILAGDALLTLGFEIMAGPDVHPEGASRAALVARLAAAAGGAGMVGGQMLDLAAEDRFADERPGRDEAGVRRIQAMKTGALLRFACEAGAMVADSGPEDRVRLTRYGEAVGLAFQIADDLLDATATADAVGKATAKDAGRGKATFVALYGVEGARKRLAEIVHEADAVLAPYGGRADLLRRVARYVADRQR